MCARNRLFVLFARWPDEYRTRYLTLKGEYIRLLYYARPLV